MNSNGGKSVLVTGASGLLGSHVALLATQQGPTVALYGKTPVSLPGCTILSCDLADGRQTDQLLESVRPRVIIHSAALTNVDDCEDQKPLAQALMVETTARMATWCRK